MKSIVLVFAILAHFCASENVILKPNNIGQVISLIRHEEKRFNAHLNQVQVNLKSKTDSSRLMLRQTAENLREKILNDSTKCHNVAQSVDTALGFFINHERMYKICDYEEQFNHISNLQLQFNDFFTRAKDLAKLCNKPNKECHMFIKELKGQVMETAEIAEKSLNTLDSNRMKCIATKTQEMSFLLSEFERNWMKCLNN